MRFTVATVLAFAASAMAAVGVDAVEGFDAINTPAEGEKVPAGKPYVVKWDKPKAPYTDGKVFIQVLGGKDPNTLQVREEKVATVDNSDQKYTWNVKSSLGDDPTYGLRFVWEEDEQIVQYSQFFHIVKAEGSGDDSDETTTATGLVKTVTLSSASTSSTTTTTTTNTTTTTTTSEPETTTTTTTTTMSTPAHNSTTHSSTMTKTTSQTSGTATTVPSGSPSSGAARVAGSVAAVGGLVAALFAL